jgi:hypothetical protein
MLLNDVTSTEKILLAYFPKMKAGLSITSLSDPAGCMQFERDEGGVKCAGGRNHGMTDRWNIYTATYVE